MGWLNEETKKTFIDGWGHFFHGRKYFNSKKISKETGLSADMVECFNVAAAVSNFTRKFKHKIPEIAAKIPVGDTKRLTEDQEIELIYDCINEALNHQRLKHPDIEGWLDVLRVCARGREKHKKFYVLTQNFLVEQIRKVNIQRMLLRDEIENRVVRTTRPRKRSAEYKVHVEYAAVEAIYQTLMHVCYPKEKHMKGILKQLIISTLRGFRQDGSSEKVGKWVVRLMKIYIELYSNMVKKG